MKQNRKLSVLLVCAALALAMIPFFRAWNYGMVDLDDYLYLTMHQPIVEWSGWESIKHAFTNVSEGIWMPVTWFSYALDCALFGTWYGGFHIHSILVHFANSLLVWWFLCEVFARLPEYAERKKETQWFCLLAALVWAVHPLRCESVVFLASRKDVLSFFWELIALICWVKGGAVRTVVATLCFMIGAMCKPSVMTFPVLCFLIDAFVKREVKILRYVVPILFAIFLGAFAGWQQKMGGATTDMFNQPLWGRLLGACAAFGIYLRNFVWPQWLAPQCVKTWPMLPRFWLPGLVISAVWGGLLLRRALAYWDSRKQIVEVEKFQDEIPVRLTSKADPNPLFAGAAWFAVAVAPMLGIANFGFHSFADRFTYIPAVGLSLLLVVGLTWLSRKICARVLTALGVLVVLALAACSWWQTGFWVDDHKLFTHTLEVDGDHNTSAHGVLANWYFEFTHDLEKSVAEFDKASSQNFLFVLPSFEVYAIALAELGREDELVEKFRLFEATVTKLHGPERARKIFSSDSDLTFNENFLRNIYYCSRLALWVHTKNGIAAAEDLIGRMRGSAVEEDSVWLYLRWKLALRKGEAEEAERLLEKLKNGKACHTGYLRFRYLK